jgi:hypothetical protein
MFSQQKINAVVDADRNSRGYPIYIGWRQSLGANDGAKTEKGQETSTADFRLSMSL